MVGTDWIGVAIGVWMIVLLFNAFFEIKVVKSESCPAATGQQSEAHEKIPSQLYHVWPLGTTEPEQSGMPPAIEHEGGTAI